MTSYPNSRHGASGFWRINLAVVLALAGGISGFQRLEAAANVSLFDTGSRLADPDAADDRSAWKPVPANLFTLEAEPAKAASDPGYYGRDYSFKGDAVVENRTLAAYFWSAQGRVVIYARASGGADSSAPGRRIADFIPLQSKAKPMTISRCEVVRNAGDEVAVEVFFSAPGSGDISALFSFGKSEIVEIRPAPTMKGISLASPIEYGVAPGFIGDDLIFGPAEYPSVTALTIPADNLFLGLLRGEDSELVMTWPKGRQQLRLVPGKVREGRRWIESIDFDNDGQGFYLAPLSTPGLWHREELNPDFLEKDVALQWKRPFPAKWTTQLEEAGVKTTFTFRETKAQIWRGVPGSYSYPVWLGNDTANYHLSKKVPPRGESVIYFLEGDNTPASITTPVDILKATLGRSLADEILDVPGRKLRTHHRRGGDGVHRACTCGCTEAIQAVFEAGEEVARNDYVCGAVDDMVYFVSQHVQRIDEYRHFADDLIQLLRTRAAAAPDLRGYTAAIEQIAQQIPNEYSVQKENMKSLTYAGELARKTITLAGKQDTRNVAAYAELSKDWRAMGGAQDYVLAQCHMIARKLLQEAGYAAAGQPKAQDLAQEIKKRARQCLRNPDGYEIWPDYR